MCFEKPHSISKSSERLSRPRFAEGPAVTGVGGCWPCQACRALYALGCPVSCDCTFQTIIKGAGMCPSSGLCPYLLVLSFLPAAVAGGPVLQHLRLSLFLTGSSAASWPGVLLLGIWDDASAPLWTSGLRFLIVFPHLNHKPA